MSSRPRAADYAAIAVGPVLIFLMISSLANYFVMLFYEGGYSDRIFYLILMYTMGSVALARLVIEQDRAYTAGYSLLLGLAMLFVASGFIGSFVVTLLLILLIGFLADRIVHDCTVIDESVDASGEGLIDRGIDEAIGFKQANQVPDDAPVSEAARRRRKSHQPGRTVFLLALAALPLFGVGQFVLRNDPQVWFRAQLMLALYLFASLSLLVTTSFLNLRRYLRQRDVDMPGDVTVAWLAGGVGLVAALLMLAFLAPLPGTALASLSMPKFLSSDEMSASSWGWGNEAAERSQTDSDAETSGDRRIDGKDQKGGGQNQNRSSGEGGGSKPGSTGAGEQGGSGDSGPQQSGKSSGQQSSGQSQSGKSQSGKGSTSQQSAGQQRSAEQAGSQSQNAGQKSSNDQNSGDQPSGGQPSGSPKDGQQASGQQASGQQASGQRQSGEQDPANPASSNGSDEPSQSKSNSRPQSQSQRQSTERQSPSRSQDLPDASPQEAASERPDSARSPQQSSATESSSSMGRLLSQLAGGLGRLLRLLLVIALIGVVAFYVYQMREQLIAWWRQLFERPTEEPGLDVAASVGRVEAPQRPFASFNNPIGREQDPRRVVVVTFQAFEAWARERGWSRAANETPAEFVERLRRAAKGQAAARAVLGPIGAATDRLAKAYDRIVYGRGSAAKADIVAAESLWQHMAAASVAGGSTSGVVTEA